MPHDTAAVHRRTIERAAALVGGKGELQRRLRVPMQKLDAWLAGAEPVPLPIFLKTVDLINTAPAPTPAPVAAQRRVREDSAREFLHAAFQPTQTDAMLAAALDAAIEATRADGGAVHLAGPEGLRIVASRGERPILDLFARVADEAMPWSRALKAGRRLVESEVQSTPIVAASGWILGVISTHYTGPREPSSDELASVDDVARRTAFWLESARA